MVKKESRSKIRVKKHKRIRNRLSGTPERPRLAVSSALFAITVPTYAAASTLLVFSSSDCTSFSNVEAATKVFPALSSIIYSKKGEKIT